MMDEIKGCPFCGFDDPYFDELNILDEPMMVFLVCPECQCEGPVGSTPEEAAEGWNRRAAA